MKKNVLFFAIFLLGANLFAQDYELSNRLIHKFETSKQKALTKSATIADRLWLTPILKEAVINWDVLTDEAKNLFKGYRNRPTFTGTEEIVTYGNFAFHYTTDGPADESVDPTDNDGNNIPDYVDFMAEAFVDEIYELYHTTTGLTVPPADGTNGGDALYDVYISGYEAGEGTYGWVMAESEIGDNPNSTNLTEVDAYTSFMIMRNNYTDFSGTEAACIRVTAAHEYMHAVQDGYTGSMDFWFAEVGATWAEEFAYPGYDDNFQYLMGIFGTPDVALNLEDGEAPEHDGHWYSSFLFAQYMTEQTNNSIMKNIYERCIDYYAVDAIDAELSEKWNSSLYEMFFQFVIANVLMTDEAAFAPYTYNRAADYMAHVENNGGFKYENQSNPFLYTGTNLTWNSKTNGNDRLMRLSADYFMFESNSNFKITFSPVDPNGEVILVVLKASTSAVEFALMNENGSVNVTDNESWDYIVPIVIRGDKNVANTNAYDYNLLITAADPVSVSNNIISDVNIYPNPASDFILVSSNNTDVESYEIVDVTGKVVLSNGLINSKINVSSLDKGLYFINIFVNSNVAKTEKLIIY
ncbi:MAG: T9SS type A sorting domain-containing protein [Bacteroidales bacterium]|nr:T9SS type A sorting domain-containing protein [Bacteroidales bacterium]